MMQVKCECQDRFQILSLIPQNGQVNFKCERCDKYGFILNNRIFVEKEMGVFTRIRLEIENEEEDKC